MYCLDKIFHSDFYFGSSLVVTAVLVVGVSLAVTGDSGTSGVDNFNLLGGPVDGGPAPISWP